MYFWYACLLHNTTGVGGRDASTGKDGDTAGSLMHQLPQGVYPLLGIGLATRSEDAVASATDYCFQCFTYVLMDFIESTVEGDLHRGSQLDDAPGAFLVNTAFGGQEADNHGMCATSTAHLDLLYYLLILGICIDEVACPWAHEHMSAELEVVDTVTDVVGGGCGAAHFQLAAQFYPDGSARLGIDGRLAGVGTDFYIHTQV